MLKKYAKCDNCNREIVSEDYNYCPYCGEIINPKETFDYDHPCITGITLLSKEEAETLLTDDERAYSKLWWLRSPVAYAGFVYVVNCFGNIVNHYSVRNSDIGVRPVLKINISTSNFKVGDIFSFGGKEFKIISDSLAWMYNDDIGNCTFCAPMYSEDANIYETSKVKQYVENWLHDVIFKKI